VTSFVKIILPSAPPNEFPFFQVPASWKPSRMAPRAKAVQRPEGPLNLMVSSSETYFHTQQVSFWHWGLLRIPGAL